MSLAQTILARVTTTPLVFRRLTQSIVNGVPQEKTYTRYATINGVYYKGAARSYALSDKIRPDVSGVVVAAPEDINNTDIQKDDRIDICALNILAAINHTGGYATGATSIAIDGVDDSAWRIKKDDTFFVIGETGSPEHRIIAVASTGSVTTGLTFTPALASTVADDTQISISQIKYKVYVIQPDDIAQQDQVIAIPVKEAM